LLIEDVERVLRARRQCPRWYCGARRYRRSSDHVAGRDDLAFGGIVVSVGVGDLQPEQQVVDQRRAQRQVEAIAIGRAKIEYRREAATRDLRGLLNVAP